MTNYSECICVAIARKIRAIFYLCLNVLDSRTKKEVKIEGFHFAKKELLVLEALG